MSLSQAQRRFVRQRAGECCEYCRLAAQSTLVPFHIDHIIPVKHGGLDDEDNLCLACYNCNLYKSHDLAGFDPATGALSRLFHPREQNWSAHFEIMPDLRIRGLTPEGRTTVQVLQINLDERVEARRALAEIGEYPCIKESTDSPPR